MRPRRTVQGSGGSTSGLHACVIPFPPRPLKLKNVDAPLKPRPSSLRRKRASCSHESQCDCSVLDDKLPPSPWRHLHPRLVGISRFVKLAEQSHLTKPLRPIPNHRVPELKPDDMIMPIDSFRLRSTKHALDLISPLFSATGCNVNAHHTQ